MIEGHKNGCIFPTPEFADKLSQSSYNFDTFLSTTGTLLEVTLVLKLSSKSIILNVFAKQQMEFNITIPGNKSVNPVRVMNYKMKSKKHIIKINLIVLHRH